MSLTLDPRCGFCGLLFKEAHRLVRGINADSYICQNCVDDCLGIFDETQILRAVETKTKKKAKDARPTPREIKDHLDKYIIGQDKAKKILSVAVYNHYKRIGKKSQSEILKSNILLIGPSGSGKTLAVETLAKLLDVPFAQGDATTMTSAGYVGEDVDSVLVRLVQNAEGDIKRAQHGIVYIDECFPASTEILTETGFVHFADLKPGVKVAQFGLDNKIDFVFPERIINRPYEGPMIEIKSEYGQHISTPNHERVVFSNGIGFSKLAVNDSLDETFKVPVAGELDGPGVRLTDNQLRLTVALMVNGFVRNKSYLYLNATKEEKKEKIKQLLLIEGIKYSRRDYYLGFTRFFLGDSFTKHLDRDEKGTCQISLPKSWIPELSLAQRKVVIEEVRFWTNQSAKAVLAYSSKNKSVVDVVAVIASTSGYSSRVHTHSRSGYADTFTASIGGEPILPQTGLKTSKSNYDGNVYCVTVPSRMIMIREGSTIQISGNCDKIASRDSKGKDVNGEGVQQALLKMIEGSLVSINPSGKKSASSPTEMIDTTNILFICGGAFSALTDVSHAKRPLGLTSSSAGSEPEIKQIRSKDLVKFGMIPEFIGRLPLIAQLAPLRPEDLVRVLTEPKNALTKQFTELFSLDGVKLTFDPEFLLKVAERAHEEGTGARGLRSILEPTLLDLMFRMPEDAKTEITITLDYLEEKKSDERK